MNEFKSVLFPIDFSLRCEAAIPFVKEMVRRCRAKLTLLHVVKIPVDWSAAVTPSLHLPWDEFETQYKLGRECLGGFACCFFGDISREGPLETLCQRGDPASAILAHVRDQGCDLIMMPTHGAGAFRSLFLGSVTARVLHQAECAVWTDAHIETGLSSEFLKVRKILCAIKCAENAVALTREAVALARQYDAEVELVHAAEGEAAGTARDEIAGIQQQTGTRLKVHIGEGSVRQVIRDTAMQLQADLVIMGRGHVQQPFSRLRSHAYSVIQDSPCPVLSC